MTDSLANLTPELRAAQQQLMALRQSLGIDPDARPLPVKVARPSAAVDLSLAQTALAARRRHEVKLQGHLASDALKAACEESSADQSPQLQPQPSPALKTQPSPELGRVKVYPTLAVTMLEQGLGAPGRVYWLLRYIDIKGQGWLDVDTARERLTKKGSPLKICTWRRLRQILHQGEGIFWHRDGVGRLWLQGAARVALNLSVERLTGQPVAIPIKQLLGGIQAVRAQFYASFHSGRRINNPVSRETLKDITSVPERTQLEYEKTAAVTTQRNMAVGESYTQAQAQERAWQHGRATFHFIDTNGQQGKAGREYVAWHLPNSYIGPHAKCCKGRQKKINRRLVDLVMKGMRGNGREQVEKVFWPHGAAAGAAYNRNQKNDAYWLQGRTNERAFGLWHTLSGKR